MFGGVAGCELRFGGALRRPTPPDAVAYAVCLVDEAEHAQIGELAAAVIRARHAVDEARAALADAADVLSRMTTPVVELMTPAVELRRRAVDQLAARLDVLAS